MDRAGDSSQVGGAWEPLGDVVYLGGALVVGRVGRTIGVKSRIT